MPQLRNEETTAEREVLSVSEAAQRLGMSVQCVRRRVKWEALEAYWTDPASGHKDVNGNQLRGHLRIYADSVEAYLARTAAAAQGQNVPSRGED